MQAHMHTRAHAHTRTAHIYALAPFPHFLIAPRLSNTHETVPPTPPWTQRAHHVLSGISSSPGLLHGMIIISYSARNCFRQHLYLLFNITFFILIYFSCPTAKKPFSCVNCYPCFRVLLGIVRVHRSGGLFAACKKSCQDMCINGSEMWLPLLANGSSDQCKKAVGSQRKHLAVLESLRKSFPLGPPVGLIPKQTCAAHTCISV